MALFTALSDNFNDNSLAAQWGTWTQGTATIAETDGRIQVSLPVQSSGNHYAAVFSQAFYDLTNTAVFCEVPTYVTGINSQQYLAAYNSSQDVLHYISLEGSTLNFIASDPTSSDQLGITFDPVSHRWWRIRHTSTPAKVWFDTSPDAVTWTNRHSSTLVGTVTSLIAEMAAGTFGVNPSAITATFDNFNYKAPVYNIVSSASGGGSVTGLSETATISITSSASGGGSAAYLTAFQPLPQKDYEYRVKKHDGTYVGIWQNVKSDFSYDQTINQNASELTVEIARSPDNTITKLATLQDTSGATVTDENSDPILVQTETANAVGPDTDVEYNYNVDVYAFYGGYEALLDTNGNEINDDTGDTILSQYGFPNGKRVYSGYIVDYDLTYGQQTGVTVTIAPHATEMSHYIFKSGSSTTVSYNSTDPVVMARAVMDNYISQGGVIGYNSATMPLSGSVSSYDFKLQRTREAIDKTVDLLPSGYYHFVDPGENLQYLLAKGSTADHTFWYENHISELKLKKSISQLINKVYFVGGDTGGGTNLFTYNEDATSIADIRPGLDIQSDSRVNLESSADILSNREIAEFKNPRYRTTVTITDAKYDIELIKLGDMVGFKNFGTFADSLILQVVTLHRKKHSVTLDLDSTLPSDAKRLEDLKRALLSEQIRNTAATPI